MAELKIDLREHPARAQHPITKQPLDMVHPLVKDWRAVYLVCEDDAEDMFLGYVTPNRLFHLQVSERTLGGPGMADEIRRLVGEQIGTDGKGATAVDAPADPGRDEFDDLEEEDL